MFFSTDGLNEEELREKLAQLNARLFSAAAMGMSYDIRVQLENMIDTIEFELRTRWQQDIQKMWDDQFPDIIESEPDLKPGAQTAIQKKEKKEDRPERPADAPKFNKVYRK